MPVYSNRFTVQVADERAGLMRQYTEIMATVADAEAAASASAADAADAAASAEAAALAAGFIFDSRASLAAAAGDIADGQIVSVRGIYAVKDAAATGAMSALNDLGVNGFRLMTGNIVPARWWTEGMTSDASAMLTAANAYGEAYRVSGSPMTIVIDENVNIANPITLGGSGPYAVDTSGARITLIAGGAFTSNPNQWSVRVRGSGVSHNLGTIFCEHLGGGWAYEDCVNAFVNGPRAERFTWRGHYTINSCAGMTLHQATGMEWGGLEQTAGGFSNSQYVSDGIYLDTNDVRVTLAHIGYCLRAIVLASGASGNEIIDCHPFNAIVAGAPARSHPICIWNECASRVHIYDTYLDCGYLVDTTATATVIGCWSYNDLVTMNHPSIRISGDATPTAATRGSVQSCQSSVGYYTGSHTGAFNQVTDIQNDATVQTGYGRRNEVTGKRVRLIGATSDPEAYDDYTAKRGNSSTAIRERFAPGTGNVVQVEYLNGECRISRTTGTGRIWVSPTTNSGIGSDGSNLSLWANGTHYVNLDSSGVFRPVDDNVRNLGGPSSRWATVYAGTGTINTSDLREKQDVRDVTAAEKAVAKELRKMFRAFRYTDAVAIKGDAARVHFGVMAQEAAAAFEAEGLDPFRYGVICYDEWPDELDADGNIVTPAGNRWGVRYDELLAFIVAAL